MPKIRETKRSMIGQIVLLFGLFCAVFISTTMVATITATPTFAAEKKKTLFDLFFKKQETKKTNVVRPAPTKSTNSKKSVSKTTRLPKRKTIARAAAVATTPQPEVREKLETARNVLIIGDFVAGGMAEGLITAFQESPGVRIIDASNGSSGLVRDDYYDWPGSLQGLIDEHKPQIIVALLGSNDRQPMRIEGTTATVRSDAWMAEYRARAAALTTIIAGNKIPLIWVGQVPFSSGKMTADMLAFNDVYNSAVTSIGGSYVDIWNGFADENGKFVTLGADLNGQNVRLRAKDGINITRAGKRKIAFFAEKPLRRILGGAASPQLGLLGPENLPALSLSGPVIPDFAGNQPISLLSPDLDGGDVLLGEVVVIKRADGAQTIAEKMRIDGIIPEIR